MAALLEAAGGVDGDPPRLTQAQAARDAITGVLRARELVLSELDADIVALIEQALARITAQLMGAPSDYQLWVLPRLVEGIRTVLDALAATASARASGALRSAWELGVQAVDAPLLAEAGTPPGEIAVANSTTPAPAPGAPSVQPAIRLAVQLGVPDLRQLRAMQAFTTEKIKDATADTVRAINSSLGQVVLGASTPFQAMQQVAKLLPTRTAAQVRGIVATNTAMAFNSASFATLQKTAARDPAIYKQWRRSGKRYSRDNHDAIDGQVKAVNQPFVVIGGSGRDKGKPVDLMFPCDPKAPLGEVIHCGCVCIPWKATWKMRNATGTPFTAQELAGRATPRPRRPAAPGTAPTKPTPQQRALEAFPTGRLVDVTGQTVRVDGRLLPAALGDTRLVRQGRDLAAYWAVQTLRRPTEVWAQESVDAATGELLRTRRFIKSFKVGGLPWLGTADVKWDTALQQWVATGPLRLAPAPAGPAAAEQGLRELRAGLRVWPARA